MTVPSAIEPTFAHLQDQGALLAERVAGQGDDREPDQQGHPVDDREQCVLPPHPRPGAVAERPVPVRDVGDGHGHDRRDQLRGDRPDAGMGVQELEQTDVDDEADPADHPEGAELLDQESSAEPGAAEERVERGHGRALYGATLGGCWWWNGGSGTGPRVGAWVRGGGWAAARPRHRPGPAGRGRGAHCVRGAPRSGRHPAVRRHRIARPAVLRGRRGLHHRR